jgi:vacuolar-type H+-ATPase subunit I/STV1
METTYKVFLVLHFIGLAGLLGGLLSQISAKPKKLQPFVLHSAWLMIIAGTAMVGINQAMHSDDATVELINQTTVGIKSAVIAVILTLGYMNIKKAELSTKIWGTMTGLAVLNICLAVFGL